MTAIDKIEEVLQSGVLLMQLVVVPSLGATDADIAEEEKAIGQRLSTQYKCLLRKWNGLYLDVINFLGCGRTAERISTIRERQVLLDGKHAGLHVIGFDPAGFLYLENEAGRILSLDTDGLAVKPLANSFDDLVLRLVFGEDAAVFAGEDWKNDLLNAGLIS